jgi:hypothetical protein
VKALVVDLLKEVVGMWQNSTVGDSALTCITDQCRDHGDALEMKMRIKI